MDVDRAHPRPSRAAIWLATLACVLVPASAGAEEPAPASASAASLPETGVVLSTFESGNKDQRFSAVTASGARWARLFVDWSVVERHQGKLDAYWLGAYDDAIARLDRAGVKALLAVTGAPAWASGVGDGITPPRDPGDYARFVGALARRYAGKAEAYEIWNEPDENVFWRNGPDPVRYTELLRAAHGAIKAADPRATVVMGGLVGNNYDFVEKTYNAGSKGFFDAVAVHTDTACLTKPPEEAYREPNGRIGRYSFTGYREVHAVTAAHGDAKPIWMTELGWSTTSEQCGRGASAGQKAAGVSEADQALFVSRAFHCLKGDPFVQVGIWFNLQDRSATDTEMDRYGLMRADGSHKPAFEAFSAFSRLGDALTGPCGPLLNSVSPVVTIASPTQAAQFFDHLPIAASATDDLGVNRLEFAVDGNRIRPFSGAAAALDWMGARNLAFGPHKLTVTAYDDQRNVGVATVDVVRVNPATMRPVATGTVLSSRGSGRSRTVSGQVSAPATPLLKIAGKVVVMFDRYDKPKRKWVTTHKYLRNASAPFEFAVTVKKGGRWRVYATYQGMRPFRGSKSRATTFDTSSRTAARR